MVYRKRIYYTAAQKAEMWDRWQQGRLKGSDTFFGNGMRPLIF